MNSSKELLEEIKTLVFKAYSTGLLEKTDDNKLTFIQRNILLFISKQGGITMVGLCKLMSIARPSMTRIIDTLEKRELVKRTKNPGDRRSYIIVLTQKGEIIINKLDQRPLIVMDDMLAGSKQSEVKSFIDTTSKLVKLLSPTAESSSLPEKSSGSTLRRNTAGVPASSLQSNVGGLSSRWRVKKLDKIVVMRGSN